MNHAVEFGKLLAEMRSRAGLTRAQFAQRADLEASHLYRLEKGQRRPSREAVIRAADALALADTELNLLLGAAGYTASPLLGAMRGSGRRRDAPPALARRLDSLGLDAARLERLLAACEMVPPAARQEFARAFSAAMDAAIRGLESPVKAAVVPAAGGRYGVLPAHVTQQLLLHAVTEAVHAGISRVVLVLPPGARAALFDPLHAAARLSLLPPLELLACEQRVPEGLGAAVLAARPLAGAGPFAVLLPDDLIYANQRAPAPDLAAMIGAHARLGGAGVLALAAVGRSMIPNYGVTRLTGGEVMPRVTRVGHLVEKPGPAHPIRRQRGVMGIVGRYVLAPAVWDALDALSRKGQRPLELTAALEELRPQSPVYGFRLSARREDFGVAVARTREALTPVWGPGAER